MSHLLPSSHYLVLISSHSRPEANLDQLSQPENYSSGSMISDHIAKPALLGVSSVLTSCTNLKAGAFSISSPTRFWATRILSLNDLETIPFKWLLTPGFLWKLWYLLLRNIGFLKLIVADAYICRVSGKEFAACLVWTSTSSHIRLFYSLSTEKLFWCLSSLS